MAMAFRPLGHGGRTAFLAPEVGSFYVCCVFEALSLSCGMDLLFAAGAVEGQWIWDCALAFPLSRFACTLLPTGSHGLVIRPML